ncbi:MAG: AAA family ATPase [Myxococcota bacterium]|nr:AAA family ATPase [Myxococcota bacterium]
MSSASTTPLPTVHPARLEDQPHGPRWLVEPLWPTEAVGLLAGAPKSCKSWLALDLAVSVATNTPCLGSLPCQAHGPVVLFAAEDAQPILRRRLEALAAVRDRTLFDLDLSIIATSSLRLDTERDQERLDATLTALHPVLLVLDPLIRLHALDENSSKDVSALLSYFRRLQRDHHLALLLVHHMRKNGNGMAGDSLRGSSDLHAWVDVGLYLRRTAEGILLTVEHRAHASPDPFLLRLEAEPQPHLVAANATTDAFSPDDQILDALQRAGEPLTTRQLCAAVRGRTQMIVERLHDLAARGLVRRETLGWLPAQLDLLPRAPPDAFPVSGP